MTELRRGSLRVFFVVSAIGPNKFILINRSRLIFDLCHKSGIKIAKIYQKHN